MEAQQNDQPNTASEATNPQSQKTLLELRTQVDEERARHLKILLELRDELSKVDALMERIRNGNSVVDWSQPGASELDVANLKKLPEYEAEQEKLRHDYILQAISLFELLPKQIYFLDAYERDPKRNNHVMIGGYDVVAKLTKEEGCKQLENLLDEDRAQEHPRFTIEGIDVMIEQEELRVAMATNALA